MTIVNILHVGDKQYNWDDLTPEEKQMYSQKMNDAALAAIGYERVKEPTAKEA